MSDVAALVRVFGLDGRPCRITLTDGTTGTYLVASYLHMAGCITALQLLDTVGRTINVPWHAVVSTQPIRDTA